jgi:hypothetical protein
VTALVTILSPASIVTQVTKLASHIMGRPPIGSQAMTDAERQRRHRGHAGVSKYCGKPGEQIKGIGWYADGDEKPRQLYCCRSCLLAALGLYKQSRNADYAN